jgi:hypothetical protein
MHTMNVSVGVEVLVQTFLTSALGGGERVTSLYRQEKAFPFPRFEPWLLNFPILSMVTMLTALFHLRVPCVCIIKVVGVAVSLEAKPDGD